MKNNPGQVPSHIFDWLQALDFTALATEQQEEVLRYFTREEYEELHYAAKLATPFAQPVSTQRKAGIKQELLQQFDAKQTQKKRAISPRAVTVWKAAAVLLLCCCAGLSYRLIRKTEGPAAPLLSATDTVYITREIVKWDTVKQYDTVYLQREKTVRQKSSPYYVNERQPKEKTNRTAVFMPTMDDIHILSVKDLESPVNQPRRNSMKDDSLTGRYATVTL